MARLKTTKWKSVYLHADQSDQPTTPGLELVRIPFKGSEECNAEREYFVDLDKDDLISIIRLALANGVISGEDINRINTDYKLTWGFSE